MLNQIGIILLLSLFFGQGCSAGAPTRPLAKTIDAVSHKTQPTVSESGTARTGENVPAAGAVSRVYRDPVTGEFTAPPHESKVPSAPVSIREAVSTELAPTAHEIAIEGGGTLIHLQGRFRSYLSATKDSTGKVTVHCNDKPNAELHEGKASEK